MKKTIAIAATFLVALVLTFYFTGGMFSNPTPVVQSYYLTNTDSIHTFYVGGYKNVAITAVDTVGAADTLYVQLGGSDADENYAPVAVHEINTTTLTTLVASGVPTTTGTTRTYVIPSMKSADYPFSWIRLIKKGSAGVHRFKVLVKAQN